MSAARLRGRPVVTGGDLVVLAGLGLLCVFVVQPLGRLLTLGFNGEAWSDWLAEPHVVSMLANTLLLGAAVAVLTVPLAFFAAYLIEHSLVPFRRVVGWAAQAPLLAPSLLPALALVYLFGRQGLLRPYLAGDIYGAHGVILADVFATLPHALVVLRPALAGQDGRLYEQARLLGASPARIFLTVTLPAARHGLFAAALVVFALAIADVGAPKVVGGDFPVLALDIYRRVVGQQNFDGGAISALFLLAPTTLAAVAERWLAARQAAGEGARATRYRPPVRPPRDRLLAAPGLILVVVVFGMLAVCQLAAFARMWPYDLSLSLGHYDLDSGDGGGWGALLDSVLLGVGCAIGGTVVAFVGAYAALRGGARRALSSLYGFLALVPAAAPGLALGLGIVLAFDDPAHPFTFLYGTPALLGLALCAHVFTAPHLASVGRLKNLDPAFEAAARVFGRGGASVFLKVIVPLSAATLVEIALYIFINAMTSVSASVLLYPPDFKLASVAVLNMDDAGDEAAAAAMGMMIVYVNLVALVLAGVLERRLSGGRSRSAAKDGAADLAALPAAPA